MHQPYSSNNLDCPLLFTIVHSRLWKKRRNTTKLSIKQNIYLQITGVKPFHSNSQHYSKHSVNLTKNKTTSRNICKTTLKFYQVYVISSKAQVSLICLLTLMSFIILLKRDNNLCKQHYIILVKLGDTFLEKHTPSSKDSSKR